MDQLKGKRILFVENSTMSGHYYIQELRKKGAYPVWVKTLKSAVRKLKNKSNRFDAAIIDLNMPPIPTELEKYINKIELTVNHGETLGLFIKDHFKKKDEVPFLFLTMVPDVVSKKNDKLIDIKVLYKKEFPSWKLPEAIVDIFNWNEEK